MRIKGSNACKTLNTVLGNLSAKERNMILSSGYSFSIIISDLIYQ